MHDATRFVLNEAAESMTKAADRLQSRANDLVKEAQRLLSEAEAYRSQVKLIRSDMAPTDTTITATVDLTDMADITVVAAAAGRHTYDTRLAR
ncbi:MAG: hypothetical protein ACRED4_00880 [Brevundimonas sp.]